MSIDYRQVAQEAHVKLRDLIAQRDSIQLEIDKTLQLFHAAVGLVPEEERAFLLAELEAIADDYEVGITDAVRSALRNSPKQWTTATEIRDMLLDRRFPFRKYSSNPLASISTILRRLCPSEAEKITIDGVAAYRSKSALRRVGQRGDQHASNKHEK